MLAVPGHCPGLWVSHSPGQAGCRGHQPVAFTSSLSDTGGCTSPSHPVNLSAGRVAQLAHMRERQTLASSVIILRFPL